MRIEFRAKSALRFSPGTKVTYEPWVEVTLACGACGRNHRTVRVRHDGATCVKESHEYAAKIDAFTVEDFCGLSLATYAVSFDYTAFRDTKTGEASVRFPRWGRIAFQLTCPACKHESSRSTQTNIARPWQSLCRCGEELYVESGQLPLFECFALGEKSGPLTLKSGG